MTAAERFKKLLANAYERVCVLEEQLELAQQKITELEEQLVEARHADSGRTFTP